MSVRTSEPRERVASSSRNISTTSTRSFGRMKPPAFESPPPSILIATARIPLGKIADMKPPCPFLTSLSLRIGSPRRNESRVIAPLIVVELVRARGFDDHLLGDRGFRPGLPIDRVLGHDRAHAECLRKPRAPGRSRSWERPPPREPARVCQELKNKKAAPKAAIEMPSTAICVRFIRVRSYRRPITSRPDYAALIVKLRLIERIQNVAKP